MEKYQKMMLESMEKTIGDWKKRQYIYEYELYRFFHSIKGTAKTIDMRALSQEAGKLLFLVDEKSNTRWKKTDWSTYVERLQLQFKHIRGVDDFRSDKEGITPISDILSGQEDTPFILLIDNDVEFVMFMKDFLEENGFQVVIALTGEKGLELFYNMKPGVIIIDFLLPDIEGISLLARIVDKAQKDFTPVIMVSALTSTENRAKAYELGAFDFIGKPIEKNIFIPFVKNRLKLRDHILKQVGQDELTGANNRKFLEKELYNQKQLLIQGKSEVYSFAMVDLDHFKTVNDQHGHQIGDEVLKAFVDCFMKVKDTFDSISRYGGEEFAVVYPNKSDSEAVGMIQRWREEFNAIDVQSEGVLLNVTFSAGLKEVRSSDLHRKDIVDHADKALYFAKDTGRNKTSVYEEMFNQLKTKDDVTLIIVDDDKLVREMLTDHFTKRKAILNRPISVTTYPDGLSFLEDDWYNHDQQYIILLDGIMPKMDGMEVLQKVRKQYGNKNIVISMLTARKGEAEVARALNIGADDYMLKPFNVQEVATRLDRLFERVYK